MAKTRTQGTCPGCGRERYLGYRGGICETCHRNSRPKEKCCRCERLVIPVSHDSEGAWCQTCRSKHRAEPCSVCGKTGPVAKRREGQPVCRRCWQRETRVPRPCHVCGRTMKATRNTAQGVLCSGCHRKTLPKEPCWVCGKVVRAAARTDEGAWCERCRKHRLAEPCSLCGHTGVVTTRREDGGAICKTCYQRRHQRPLRQCIDCRQDKPVARHTDDGPLCETCDDRRAPIVLCPTCGKKRKVGVLSTGVCRACANRARPRHPCRQCGKVRAVAYRGEDGKPWCDGCRRRAQAEPCSGCGRRMVITARTESGPWCSTCWDTTRTGPACQDCGERPAMPTPAGEGVPRCVPCYSAARVPCTRCGTTARAERRWPEGPVCLACVDAVRFTHESCRRCGQLAAVFQREPAGPVCPECADVAFTYRCPTCGAMGRLLHGECPPCRARRELGDAFASPDGQPSPRLARLAQVLEKYDNPYSLVLYLRRPGGQLIRDLAHGRLDCTHEALDALRQTPAVQHLRALLVLAEILEPREEELAQLKRDIAACLNEVDDPQDHTVLARYARWHLTPLAHERADQRGFTRHQREHLRRKLHAARRLLAHIRCIGRRLDTVTQDVIDRWLIAHRPQQPHARAFLLWAATSGLAPANVAIATAARRGDRDIMSDADRIVTALKLETDDSLPPADRVAGCLILQYGQRPDRIVNLTTDHVMPHPVENGVLGLQLGRDPLWLRPRLSALLQVLIDQRRPLAAPLRDRSTLLLFPGLRPDRPITSTTLQHRLKRLGVPSTSKARNGAWLALVGAVHWKMLADLLGVADGTAAAWHQWNGGDRASYVASRLRAAQAPTSPE